MVERKSNSLERESELKMYRSLVLATLDYYIENNLFGHKTQEYNPQENLKNLKVQMEQLFNRGSLTKLKQCFRDFTEMLVETTDLKFNTYLCEKTGYNIDIFKAYFQRIDKIIEKGRITSDRQYYDINMAVGQLCQIEPVNNEIIEVLNGLLSAYEQRKSNKTKKNA